MSLRWDSPVPVCLFLFLAILEKAKEFSWRLIAMINYDQHENEKRKKKKQALQSQVTSREIPHHPSFSSTSGWCPNPIARMRT